MINNHRRGELADEVRILELEVQKIEFEDRIAQLKAGRFIDVEYIDLQEELDECHETIKQQNQTLLRISAELEAIKQYDPFDLVLITGSIENISNMIEGQTEQSINEECVGCAGPCKVVDVAAKLQKELDSTIGQLVDSRKRCDYLSTKITEKRGMYDELDRTCGDLRAELYDLRTHLPDNFWAVVTEKDSMIRRQGKVIEDFKAIETRETDRLHKIILDMDVMISDLMDNDRKINGFLDEYRVTVDNRDKTIDKITLLRVNEVETLYNLKAELSARKEDSAVLMEVVEIIKDDTIPNSKVPCVIFNLVKDYLDAPEGPPETPIDDLYKVTVAYTFLELP